MKMKKIGFLALSLALIGGLCACGDGSKEVITPSGTDTPNTDVKPDELKLLSYAEYLAAKDGDIVLIEGYIQDRQGWWENKATVYLQDDNGGYFVYELPCTEEQYNNELKLGNKIQVKGVKGSWKGMVEILGSESGAEASYKLVDGNKLYDYKKLPSLDTPTLIAHTSQRVAFDALQVVSVKAIENSGDDIYLDVTDGVNTLTFCVESYLRGASTEVYKTVATLKAGDYVDFEGLMYVYENPQLHITSCKKLNLNAHQKYLAARDGATVTIEGYIQDRQGWWENKATVYLQDDNGGYFVYQLPCTEEQYNNELKLGNKIQVKGQKGSWKGMVEILGSESGAEASYKLLTGTKEYEHELLYNLDKDTLIAHTSQRVAFNRLKVVKIDVPEKSGDDIYFDVTDGTNTFTFCVESYLRGKDTDVYKTVAALKAGDLVNLEGLMYVYENPQLHVTSCLKVEATTYDNYFYAEAGSEVKISGYIQAKQGWWENKATVYLQDDNGGYFAYQLPCTKEQYNNDLKLGNHIEVTGQKGAWKGMIEIMGSEAGAEATYKVLEGSKIYEAKLLPSLDKNMLLGYCTQKVAFNNLKVVSITAPEKSGDDIYFEVTDGKTVLTFCVESYLTGADTEVYKTVAGLKAGDKVSLEGFMYIYQNPQLHTTKCTKLA